jgi:hypothetical protein
MTKETVKFLFHLAGIAILDIWQLPNRYLGDIRLDDYMHDRDPRGDCLRTEVKWRQDRPSWLVKTKYGLIDIGWRKWVIEVDWKDTGVECDVTDDNVTKGKFYVHAGSEADCLKYLTVLGKALNASKDIVAAAKYILSELEIADAEQRETGKAVVELRTAVERIDTVPVQSI